jgi:2-hydroxy-3-keto-5-methylthiopentenyl-1-phosphate phosphatase
VAVEPTGEGHLEPRIVLDWDGTATQVDTLWLLLEEFGDRDVFRRASADLRRGEIGYRSLMELELATVKNVGLAEVNAWLAGNVEMRTGFHELAARFDPLVLSSGFRELIVPLLERERVILEVVANGVDPDPSGWRIRWNRESPCELCGDWCKRGGLPAGSFVYIGDGYSDRCPALSADRVFARAGLAEYFDREGLAYEEFDDLVDVVAALDRDRTRST